MKFYEASAEDYLLTMDKYNLHPELETLYTNAFPQRLSLFENLIVYGPVGSGKYSQVLKILQKYSPSELKHEKKITVQSEKNNYTFRISDIHYEIDLSFLGCNSKNLWHDIFCQIVDIISIKQEKIGIIVCKNFHMIHSELLEIFYSYIQPFTTSHMNIKIKFIILTEHISFLPNTLLKCCAVLPIQKPSKESYKELIDKNIKKQQPDREYHKRIQNWKITERTKDILSSIDTNTLMNIKELQSFSLLKNTDEIPIDIFNIVCDKIIYEMENPSAMHFTLFRDSLYDILIYNLDVVECVWYILSHFIDTDRISTHDVSCILQKTYSFLKYYNNNYRPIYHLENIMLYVISKIKPII